MIYYIINLLTHRTLPIRIRYNLLKTAVIFYIMPFPFFKYLFPLPDRKIGEAGSGINALIPLPTCFIMKCPIYAKYTATAKPSKTTAQPKEKGIWNT